MTNALGSADGGYVIVRFARKKGRRLRSEIVETAATLSEACNRAQALGGEYGVKKARP